MTLTKYQNLQGRLPKYDIHPISIKMIDQGNPWVTKDQYSEKFHPNDRFIVALNRKRPFALLIHDPTHKFVKARLWSKNGNFEKQIKNFKNDLAQRMHSAFKSRKDQKLLQSRNNLYLLFGEADQVPGLFVQYLAGEILIQFYANFWDRYQDYVIQLVIKKMSDVFAIDIFRSNMWLQKRVDGSAIKEPPYCLDPNTTYKNITINEFGANYKVNLGQNYDIGIYTDMASVRHSLRNEFEKSQSVLNLYSYTGAFSLYALSQGATDVTSIDLSARYLEWLDENIEMNNDFDKDKHTAMAVSALDGLKDLLNQDKKFDLIICDPPSSSSDGEKRTNALKDYEKLIPAMFKLLSENGKMVVFLNTHKINKKKFQFKIHDIFKFHRLPLKTTKFLGLNEDCPAMPKFPEGCYLKGFVIEIDQTRLEKKNAHIAKENDQILNQAEIKTDDIEIITEAKSENMEDQVQSQKQTSVTDEVTSEIDDTVAKKKVTKKVAKKVTSKETSGTEKKASKKVTKKAASVKKVTKKVTPVKKVAKKATKKVAKKKVVKKA